MEAVPEMLKKESNLSEILFMENSREVNVSGIEISYSQRVSCLKRGTSKGGIVSAIQTYWLPSITWEQDPVAKYTTYLGHWT